MRFAICLIIGLALLGMGIDTGTREGLLLGLFGLAVLAAIGAAADSDRRD